MQSYAFIDMMRESCKECVRNALELKLCKIPMTRHTEQEPNSPPTSA
ncbi:hypothetical protein KVL24_04350 [Helicobacter pylori]|nr:hypothetical protein KVL24_04350 [Helicobacter pylori]